MQQFMQVISAFFVPIDSFLGLWNRTVCIALTIFSVVAFLVAEYGAHRAHGNFADPRLGDALHTRFLNLEPFVADLPNYWIWYNGGEIRNLVRGTYKSTMVHLVFLIIYHSCVVSCAFGFTILAITMTLAVNAFSFDESLWRRWVSPVLALAAWFCDVAEDMNMLKVIVQFPNFKEPDTTHWETLTARFSFAKWLLWGIIAMWWGVMAIKIRIAAPVHRAVD